ncbi:hypothetical protein [Pseudoalteromonas sp. MMG024]|uniref:hypothetical protein n=1 Tax=Pseudoalteromonas sp. MMG024 TaxID=2909980 RepID=UPI001F2CDE5F|nr:hypothetical protein [Pseudoalteromonas sp. MMG024]MCF6459077.1 hypothetical protein [Pseudoalteromonas sp. MMG024]
MANRYGLDASYFTSKLEQLIRDIDNYTPDEFARVMARMSKTADKNVVLEPEFQSNESEAKVTELKQLLKAVYENKYDDAWMFEMATQIEDAIS